MKYPIKPERIYGMPRCRNKIGARRSRSVFPELAGRSFDSQLERTRAETLCAMQRNGEISDLRFQVSIELFPGFNYKADFQYVEDGRLITEEVKGYSEGSVGSRWRDVQKAWRAFGPNILRISTKWAGGTKVVETIEEGNYIWARKDWGCH